MKMVMKAMGVHPFDMDTKAWFSKSKAALFCVTLLICMGVYAQTGSHIYCNIADGDIYTQDYPPIIQAAPLQEGVEVRVYVDGEPYIASTPISEIGFHTLRVIALDRQGNQVEEYFADFIVNEDPYFVFESRLVEWNTYKQDDVTIFHAVFILEGDGQPHPNLKFYEPSRVSVCEIEPATIGLLAYSKEGVIEANPISQMVCYIEEENQLAIEIVGEIEGTTSEIVLLRVVGSGNVGREDSFDFGAESALVIDADLAYRWASRDRGRCGGCGGGRNREPDCDRPPLPCKWVAQPPTGSSGVFDKRVDYPLCTDPITGTSYAYWWMKLGAPRNWRPWGVGEAFDRCLLTTVSGVGHARGDQMWRSNKDSHTYQPQWRMLSLQKAVGVGVAEVWIRLSCKNRPGKSFDCCDCSCSRRYGRHNTDW